MGVELGFEKKSLELSRTMPRRSATTFGENVCW